MHDQFGPEALTSQERAALLAMADGCTIEEAAWRMELAKSTVKHALERARDILDASSTTQAVALLIRHEVQCGR